MPPSPVVPDNIAQRQFLAKVTGLPGYFAAVTGGRTTSSVTKVWNGGSMQPVAMAGPPDNEDIEVSRPFDRRTDWDLIRRLRPQVSVWRTTITEVPTDPALNPGGVQVMTYEGLLVGVTPPDYDADSGDAARWTLTFAVSAVV